MGLVSNFFYMLALIGLIFLCAMCLRKRKKNQGVIFTTVQAVPVANHTVTVAPATAYVARQSNHPTQAPPIVATAYPVAQAPPSMPMPQPFHGVAPPAMPMPQPYNQGIPNQFASPPPYDQVIKDPYQQQTPYNPHYTGA